MAASSSSSSAPKWVRPAKLFPELEEVRGAAAMARVQKWNEASLGRLEAHPEFAALRQAALDIHESHDKIPYARGIPSAHSSCPRAQTVVENFWRDETAVKGLLRRATLARYVDSAAGTDEAAVAWESVLDVDALAEAEGKNWVYKGHSALPAVLGAAAEEGSGPPSSGDASTHGVAVGGRDRTLLQLSDGGKDATVAREFDLARKVFVTPETHGREPFYLPEGKSRVTWEDADTLLVGTDWSTAEAGGFADQGMTDSGYPRVVKRLRRGQKLSEATPVHFGEQKDVSNSAWMLSGTDAAGARVHDMMVNRSLTFWESETFLLVRGGGSDDENKRRVPLPKKSQVYCLFRGELVFLLKEDWRGFVKGSVLSFSWQDWKDSAEEGEGEGGEDAGPPLAVLHDAAKSKTTVEGLSQSRSAVLLSVLRDVVPGVQIFRFGEGAAAGARGVWSGGEGVVFPDAQGEGPDAGSSVDVADATLDSDVVTVTREGFLVPESLYTFTLSETGRQEQPAALLRSVPARFDASALAVEQRFAASKDGTRVPYFLVHPREMELDGSTPTLLYGYGGFEISLPPDYNGVMGKQWMERGYAFALANIRGGGEYGPEWHDAGLKTKRQCIFDDFIAVAEDLVESKVTSPKNLACMGGSNGGLLVGAMYVQRPDLFGAVVCQVPLLDMMEYHTLLAGASWMDEFGDPDDADEGAFLASKSPLHNIDENATHPPIILLTSTADDRVHPGHARKMAARLEELGKEFLLFENTDGGHAAGADLKAIARRQALEKVFLLETIV